MNNSAHALLLYYYSQLLTRIHLDRQAVTQLRRAVAIDRHCVRAWRSLGFMLASQGRTEEAATALGTALEIGGDDPVTRFNLGFIFHGQGRIAEAIAEFEQVVAAAPKNDRAWYGLGICHQDSGDFAKSVAPLQEAVKIQYFNPHAGYHLALAWFKLGERDKCQAEFERVKSFDPKMAAQMAQEFGAH
jgi:Flp pilus assembly protein TadD